MNRVASPSGSNRSIRLLLIFCGIVGVVIVLAGLIRFFSMVQHSSFSKKSQFNVLFIKNNSFREIYSFNPPNHSLSILKIKGRTTKHIPQILGVPIDGSIQFPSINENDDIQNLSSLLFHFSSKDSNLTYYDVIQMALYGYTFPKDQLQTNSISLPVVYDDSFEELSTELFNDSQIKSDDQSIQIINATNVSGLGSQLEWVISHIGAHVVAVSTSPLNESHSSMTYTGDKTYTVSRLEKILNVSAVGSNEKGISDIIITIGQDRRNLSFLQ